MSAALLLRDAARAGVRLFCQDGRLGFELLEGGFPEALRARILASREELIAHLAAAGADPGPVALARSGATLPASFGQERLWFLDRMLGGSAHYNMPVALRVRAALDPDRVEHALRRVAARHEVLRTVLVDEGGVCRQRILAHTDLALRRIDLGGLAPDARAAALQALVDEDAARPFDLAAGAPLRAALVRLGAADCALLLNVHHAAADGWSLDVLRREFLLQYEALGRAAPDPLAPLPLQYADYAQWQRARLGSPALARSLAYWEAQLAGLPLLHDLPLDHARPAQLGTAGAAHGLAVGAPLLAGLRALAARRRVTLFMLLHAAFAVLLARLSGATDIVVGTPVAARGHKALADLIGYFANTLVLRSDCAPAQPFDAFLERVRDVHLDAQSHQDVPFELLVERLKPARSASHAPLFQVMFAMADAALPDAAVTALAPRQVRAKFDLALVACVQDDGLRLDFEYNTALFAPDGIARMGRQLACLLEAIVADPAQPLHALALLDAPARRELLEDFQGRVTGFARTATIAGLFEVQAACTPRALAVACGAVELSYARLNDAANRLAHFLRGQGVGPGRLVGVCLPRSERMVVALLAILKAGGAYVALDPAYPDARLADMAEDSDLAWLLTERALVPRLAADPVLGRPRTARLALDDPGLAACVAGQPGTDPAPLATGADLAYLIYTSGSTGRPKAVRICHRNAAALIAWGGRAFDGADLRRVLCSTSLNFDLSVFELFVPLAHGGAVVVVENALALLDTAPDISLLNTVPSACRALVDAGAIPPGVRVVNLAGEALPPSLANDLFDVAGVGRVCNLYGPSEDTTYSSWISYTARPGAAVSIGRPLDDTRFYILDAHGQLVPPGVAGEIHIAGAGVALGYLNRPELTAERFLPDPFAPDGEGRMYRTGDLGRWRADGTIDYLGRNDFQVKLRGFRIELGEIEARLAACAGVRAAVVLARADEGGQRLAAYLVPEDAAVAGDGAARAAWLAPVQAALRAALPDYMQPAAWSVLAALPLTANGKVDRKALPAPEAAAPAHAWVAPATALEELIASVWQAQLGGTRVGAEDDFFALGGHSLLAVRSALKLSALMAVNLPLHEFFAAPTVRGVARALARLCGGADIADDVAALRRIVHELPDDEVAGLIAEYRQEAPCAAAA